MTTLWAIEVTPLDGRGKPWIAHYTVRSTRRYAWAALTEGCTPAELQESKRRQRKGLLRAVKVTIQIAKEKS